MNDNLARTILSFQHGLHECRRPEDRVLVGRYLAALAPLLANITLGNEVLKDLKGIQRLFGNSWLHDIEPFESAFNHWSSFRKEYERSTLSTMTVNERLFAMDLLSDFERAQKSSDADGMRHVLEQVYVDDRSADEIIRASGKQVEDTN